MKLFILKETFELDNKKSSIEKIFDYIKQAIEETEYNFSYMIVDGKEVYDEFEFYLEDNVKSIKEIEIVMLTVKELVVDNLATIADYLERAIPLVKVLSDKFQKKPEVDDWDQINELYGGISFIFESLESIDSMENLNEVLSSYEMWNEYVCKAKSLDTTLEKLKAAMEKTETSSIGQLLSSDIIPTFEDMKVKLDVLVND